MQDKMQSAGAGEIAGAGTPEVEVYDLPGVLVTTAEGTSIMLKPDEVPALIRQMREARGWSQSQLAAQAGYTNEPRKLISEVETGDRNLGLKTLSRIFAAFGGEVRIGFFTPKTNKK